MTDTNQEARITRIIVSTPTLVSNMKSGCHGARAGAEGQVYCSNQFASQTSKKYWLCGECLERSQVSDKLLLMIWKMAHQISHQIISHNTLQLDNLREIFIKKWVNLFLFQKNINCVYPPLCKRKIDNFTVYGLPRLHPPHIHSENIWKYFRK